MQDSMYRIKYVMMLFLLHAVLQRGFHCESVSQTFTQNYDAVTTIQIKNVGDNFKSSNSDSGTTKVFKSVPTGEDRIAFDNHRLTKEKFQTESNSNFKKERENSNFDGSHRESTISHEESKFIDRENKFLDGENKFLDEESAKRNFLNGESTIPLRESTFLDEEITTPDLIHVNSQKRLEFPEEKFMIESSDSISTVMQPNDSRYHSDIYNHVNAVTDNRIDTLTGRYQDHRVDGATENYADSFTDYHVESFEDNQINDGATDSLTDSRFNSGFDSPADNPVDRITDSHPDSPVDSFTDNYVDSFAEYDSITDSHINIPTSNQNKVGNLNNPKTFDFLGSSMNANSNNLFLPTKYKNSAEETTGLEASNRPTQSSIQDSNLNQNTVNSSRVSIDHPTSTNTDQEDTISNSSMIRNILSQEIRPQDSQPTTSPSDGETRSNTLDDQSAASLPEEKSAARPLDGQHQGRTPDEKRPSSPSEGKPGTIPPIGHSGSHADEAPQKQPRKAWVERRLFDDLFYEYDPGSRPVMRAGSTVNVTLSVSLTRIVDLVERNETLMSQLWIYEDWVDELLRWDPVDYGGLRSIIVPASLVWLPDIYIFNNADRGMEGFVMLNESRVTLRHDGSVTWVVPLTVQSACAVDVTYFPFDKQTCTIRLGSWIYDERQMNVSLPRHGKAEVDLTQYSPNSELDLVDATVSRDVVRANHDAVEMMMGGARPQITAKLRVRRKPLYYVYTVLAPTLVLCILNLFSFLLPCDNGDKVGIGLTVFLSLYVLQLAIAEHIPESNTLPLIGLFLTLVMTLNAISLMCATLVINIKKKGDLRYCPHVPPAILSLAKTFFSRLTCTPFINFYHYYGDCEKYLDEEDHESEDIFTQSDNDAIGFRKFSPNGSRSDLFNRSIENIKLRSGKSSISSRCSDNLAISNDISFGGRTQRSFSCYGEQQMPVNFAETHKNSALSSRGRKSSSKIYNDRSNSLQCDHLYSSIPAENNGKNTTTLFGKKPNKKKMRKEPRDPRYEWFFIAEILDKTLFLLFFITMMTTVMVSLVVVPWVHS